MRLIDVKTYELHEFITDHQPKYAILSHTWGAEEVTLPEMQAVNSAISTKLKTGFRKIEYTCQEALRAGLEWAWVDTCCIDKSSSAELSEAINSMFRWYQQSTVCYVYLDDLDDSIARNGAGCFDFMLRPCRWFTRGWCLQELLAPDTLVFFSRGWVELQRSDAFTSILCSITGIETKYLRHEEELSSASVAKKMSWAANRQCSRDEDIAYCLLGIFDINMPLLYGEGKKAFRRMQEEIWKEVEDHALLAWSVTKNDPRAWAMTGVFADSPSDFRFSGDVAHYERRNNVGRNPSTITQRGIGLDAAIHQLVTPFSFPRLHWKDESIMCEIELSCLDRKTTKFLFMLVRGTTAERKFTRIATVGNMAERSFGKHRLQQGVLNPVGRFNDEFMTWSGNKMSSNGNTVYVQRKDPGRYQYCSWNQVAIHEHFVLVWVRGMNFGVHVADFTASDCPATEPLDLDTVQREWPATTHCVHDPDGPQPFVAGKSPQSLRLIRTNCLYHPVDTGQKTAVFELLLAGNIISPNQSREDCLSLRCGIHFPTVKWPNCARDEGWFPWVCLDLIPWAEGETTEGKKSRAPDPRFKKIRDWAAHALRPAKVKTGIVATASTSWGANTMHVTMEVEDT